MNWREWVYQTLLNDEELMDLVPVGSVFGAGAVGTRPESKPFVVIRMGPTQYNSFWSAANVQIWVHDEPGDYGRIDQIIDRCKSVLNRKTVDRLGGIVSEWTGDSTDLADDGYGTITRNTSYRLVTSEGMS